MASKQCFFSIPINFFLTATKTDDVTLYWRILLIYKKERYLFNNCSRHHLYLDIHILCSCYFDISHVKTILVGFCFFLINFLNQKEMLVFKKICLRITYFLKIISEVLFIKS